MNYQYIVLFFLNFLLVVRFNAHFLFLGSLGQLVIKPLNDFTNNIIRP